MRRRKMMQETRRESETLITTRGGIIPSLSTNKRKLIAGLILLCVMLFILVDSFTNQHVEKATKSFLEWSQNGMKSNPALGIFSFICIYFVATGESIFPVYSHMKIGSLN